MWMQRGVYRFKIYAGVFWEWGMMRAFSGNGMMRAFSGNGNDVGVFGEWNDAGHFWGMGNDAGVLWEWGMMRGVFCYCLILSDINN